MCTQLITTNSTEEIFALIHRLQQLKLSDCLKIILQEKGVSIPNLHQLIEAEGYLISRGSLYRYFNPNPKSYRFPPEEFLEVFGKVLHFNAEEVQHLKTLRFYFKLQKSYFDEQ